MLEIKFDEKFIDQKTGETITRVKIKPADIEILEKYLTFNAQATEKFRQLSQQIWQLNKMLDQEGNKAMENDVILGKEVIKVREKMGLDSGWLYIVPLKVMEKRDPPPETRVI